ncbi:MAG: hypothetical protein IT580_11160 [Verrucomicrobiales bacterium]|nr:hypothetical protein [Verrucomicrobiales bacterium]
MGGLGPNAKLYHGWYARDAHVAEVLEDALSDRATLEPILSLLCILSKLSPEKYRCSACTEPLESWPAKMP